MNKAEKAVYDREYRAKNKERIDAVKRAGVLANPEREAARVKAWVEANKARSLEIKRAYRERNPEPESRPDVIARRRDRQRVYYAATRPEFYRRNRLRAHGLDHATPLWADRAAIKAIYVKARELGLHVDHEIPLRGKKVSGLHVHNNLQLLTPKANRVKGNRHAG